MDEKTKRLTSSNPRSRFLKSEKAISSKGGGNQVFKASHDELILGNNI